MAGGSDINKIGPFGNRRGQFWDGKGHSDIVQIFVSHSEQTIYSFQYQYVENGKLMLSELHGTVEGNKFDVVKLNYPKEYITRIRGYTPWNDEYVCSITFGTNLGEYGPFGTFVVAAGQKLNFNGRAFDVKLGENRQFYGFHGTAISNVDSIGVYMKPNMTSDLIVKKETDD